MAGDEVNGGDITGDDGIGLGDLVPDVARSVTTARRCF